MGLIRTRPGAVVDDLRLGGGNMLILSGNQSKPPGVQMWNRSGSVKVLLVFDERGRGNCGDGRER